VALVSRILPDRMMEGINDVVRKTTFVAYSEAAIDELYYLAQEHANREVGPGQEVLIALDGIGALASRTVAGPPRAAPRQP